MYQPGASWCVVVGVERVQCMLYMMVMYVEGAGCWLFGVKTLPGMWSLKLLREAIRSTHVLLSHAMVSVGVVLARGWAMFGSW